MTRIVIDTHVWVWAAFEDSKLSSVASRVLKRAETLIVPSVSIYEIGQKVRVDRWPGMSRDRLNELLDTGDQPLSIAALTPDIARRASLIDWDHRDLFDRIIAATALELQAPLVSMDRVFDGVTELERLWDK